MMLLSLFSFPAVTYSLIHATSTLNPLPVRATPFGWQPPPFRSFHLAFCVALAKSMMGEFYVTGVNKRRGVNLRQHACFNVYLFFLFLLFINTMVITTEKQRTQK